MLSIPFYNYFSSIASPRFCNSESLRNCLENLQRTMSAILLYVNVTRFFLMI